MACCCPPEDDCPSLTGGACATAESYRKAPQTLEPVCDDGRDCDGNVVIGPDCAPLSTVHEPLDPCDYRGSIALQAQNAVDAARRQLHVVGFRPYRVFLVWVRRDRRQVYQEFRRRELMPVEVSPLSDVDRELRSVGLDQVGGVRLTNISPNQVDEYELRGRLDRDKDLAADEQFFFEIVRLPRFNGDLPDRNRFTIGSVPFYNASKFQWELDVTAQHADRSPEGDDQTLDPLSPPRKRRLELLRR